MASQSVYRATGVIDDILSDMDSNEQNNFLRELSEEIDSRICDIMEKEVDEEEGFSRVKEKE